MPLSQHCSSALLVNTLTWDQYSYKTSFWPKTNRKHNVSTSESYRRRQKESYTSKQLLVETCMTIFVSDYLSHLYLNSNFCSTHFLSWTDHDVEASNIFVNVSQLKGGFDPTWGRCNITLPRNLKKEKKIPMQHFLILFLSHFFVSFSTVFFPSLNPAVGSCGRRN